LKSSSTGAVRCRAVPSANQIGDVLGDIRVRHFERIARGASPSEGLTILADFRILCALRKGPFGSEATNARIEKILREAGLIASPTPFYPGRPILVLKNDYNLRLYNGDVGIILPHPVSQELRAWFLDAEGQVRDFATGRLPEHETVFAMTVH